LRDPKGRPTLPLLPRAPRRADHTRNQNNASPASKKLLTSSLFQLRNDNCVPEGLRLFSACTNFFAAGEAPTKRSRVKCQDLGRLGHCRLPTHGGKDLRRVHRHRDGGAQGGSGWCLQRAKAAIHAQNHDDRALGIWLMISTSWIRWKELKSDPMAMTEVSTR